MWYTQTHESTYMGLWCNGTVKWFKLWTGFQSGLTRSTKKSWIADARSICALYAFIAASTGLSHPETALNHFSVPLRHKSQVAQ
jgi:hypothetical protein